MANNSRFSGIIDANETVVDLLCRVITVSLETMKNVGALPALGI